jgi:hypothetical protein
MEENDSGTLKKMLGCRETNRATGFRNSNIELYINDIEESDETA